ncbi:hypothetical protein GN244_ATG03340 [Phytophthora infestans]|uniref:Uncharacterized protein n=1 Tax=Phytophthora infestans TaxID=4787 RepID=A0A833SQ49_PHYIN|nr:hypothetical protein GN244_ATG03340 [Phytophthora infestans]KAF4136765.1 hypothetical protein GN958_ATG14035 [Phytophthora infestans]
MPLNLDAYVDAFGTSHGKAASKDHILRLDDRVLKRACTATTQGQSRLCFESKRRMIFPCYDDQDKESRELLCNSSSPVLLAADTLQAAYLEHSSVCQAVAEMDRIAANPPPFPPTPVVYQVSPMRKFVKSADSATYVLQEFLTTQEYITPLDGDAFSTNHGKAASTDHTLKCDDRT